MTVLLDYSHAESLLSHTDCAYSAAEAHGVACGILAADRSADSEIWLEWLIDERDKSNVLQNNSARELSPIFEQARMQLQDSNLEFYLLVPDDTEALADRVEAMQEWAQGFVLGISMSGVKSFSDFPEDTRELIQDFSQIGSAGELEMDEDDESEESYIQIVEYLRMGVLLMQVELQPVQNPTAAISSETLTTFH